MNKSLEEKVYDFIRSQGYLYGDEDEVVWAAIDEAPYVISFPELNPKYLSNKKFVFKAVQKDFRDSVHPLQYADKKLRQDRDFALEVVKLAPNNFHYLNPKLKDDDDIVDAFLRHQPDYIKHLSVRQQIRHNGYNKLFIERCQVVFISDYSEDLKFKAIHNLKKGIERVKNSPIPEFKSILSGGNIIIGRKKAFLDTFGYDMKRAVGSYAPLRGMVFLLLEEGGEDIGTVAVHELAHRFHYLGIKDGYENKDIISLYELATMSKTECKLAKLPTLGSPLSNILSKGVWDWTVKRANSDYYLKKIYKTDQTYYYYENNRGDHKIYTAQQLLKYIECPSQYGATDPEEFFSEMCTLITLGLVKSSQKRMAFQFMETIKDNLS